MAEDSDKPFGIQLPPEFFTGQRRHPVLDQELHSFSSHPDDRWTIRNACEGTQIFGATGSGKTTGSGATIGRAFLRRGMGGLVLTAKPDEFDIWVEHMEAAGRDTRQDLIRFMPGPDNHFNFLEYEYNRPPVLTFNLVSLFLTALSTGQSAVSNTDPYWNEALRELLTHTVDLAVLSTRDPMTGRATLTLATLIEIVRSAPQTVAEVSARSWKSSRCYECLSEAYRRVKKPLPAESEHERKARRADLDQTARYWTCDFPRLNDRTRSIIVSSFTAKAASLTRSPLRELFCEGEAGPTNRFAPERTFEGKVILLDLPVKTYGDVGRFAQILYKTIWQRATERRDEEAGPPVFLWADEAQYFVTSEDMLFQQTARSKRAATVYLTQNLPNYYAMLDGKGGTASTESLLGNLQTKIFHANGDPTTNEWAERVFARHKSDVATRSLSHSQDGQGRVNSSYTHHFEPIVPAVNFTNLARGGPDFGNVVQGIVFRGGRPWGATGTNALPAPFPQPTEPTHPRAGVK